MSLSQDQIVEALSGKSVLEIIALTKALEETWGVKAAPPQVQSTFTPPATTGQVEEQTEFSVILTETGATKINVIKVVREITGLGLKEAKDLVEAAPKAIKEGVSKADAAELRTKLEGAGAKVEVK